MSLFGVDLVFAEEEACWRALERARWPDGEACPGCGSVGDGARVRSRAPRYWRCRACGKLFHAALGTAMEGSHLPLRTWFRAIHLLDEAPGLSSVQFGRLLELRQKTAWLLVRRVRRMASDDPSLLHAIADMARGSAAAGPARRRAGARNGHGSA